MTTEGGHGAQMCAKGLQNGAKTEVRDPPEALLNGVFAQNGEICDPCIIYYVLAMPAAPETHRFRTGSAFKCGEKRGSGWRSLKIRLRVAPVAAKWRPRRPYGVPSVPQGLQNPSPKTPKILKKAAWAPGAPRRPPNAPPGSKKCRKSSEIVAETTPALTEKFAVATPLRGQHRRRVRGSSRKKSR